MPDGLDDAQSLQFLALQAGSMAREQLPKAAAGALSGCEWIRLPAALPVQGRWREVALRCTTGAAAPNASLSFVAYHTLALLKLSMNEQAAAELSKLKSQHVAVSNADSTAPWALRVLRSEVLWALGKRQAAIDWLYQLLEWCNAQEGSSVAAAASGGDGQQQVQLGRLRRRDIALNLVSKLRQQRQFVPALLLLNHLLGADAADLQAWMAVCSVQALLGDVSAAQATLRQVEQLLAGSSGGAGVQEQAAQRHHHQQLLHRHRGTLHFLQRDFRGGYQLKSEGRAQHGKVASAQWPAC